MRRAKRRGSTACRRCARSSRRMVSRAKKSLGQNFLLDLNLTRRIARAAGPLEGRDGLRSRARPRRPDARAAGRRRGHVIAVERDERCLPALAEIARAYPGRLEIISGDALELDEARIASHGERRARRRQPALQCRHRAAGEMADGANVAALLAEPDADVPARSGRAHRAPPGTNAYGRLSVLAQWRARPKILFDVNRARLRAAAEGDLGGRAPRAAGRTALRPRDLADLESGDRGRLRPAPQDAAPEPENADADAEALVRAAGIDPTSRPEQLSVAEFAALARAY